MASPLPVRFTADVLEVIVPDEKVKSVPVVPEIFIGEAWVVSVPPLTFIDQTLIG